MLYLAATQTITNPFSWPSVLLVGIIIGMLIMAFLKR